MKQTTIEINIQHEDLNLVGLIGQAKGLEREIVEQVVRDIEEERLKISVVKSTSELGIRGMATSRGLSSRVLELLTWT